jgi:hypothetical protein
MLSCDCPGAVISVRSSVSSLSGFVIVVRQRWRVPARASRRLCIAGLSALFLFGLIWTLFSMRLDLSMTEAVRNWTIVANDQNNESCAEGGPIKAASFKAALLQIVGNP